MKTIYDFLQLKNENKKISMLTCYDFAFASLFDKTEVDCLLVGDSVAMVQHGFESTVSADIEMMATHTRAVRRGTKSKFIISDMPFLAHRKGLKYLMSSADVLMKAGANAIKIEITKPTSDISYLVDSGIPVVCHIGLTPQSVHQLGGYKVQGKSNEQKNKLLELAKHCEAQGAFMLVLECVPQSLANLIANTLRIPVIGIGAGQGVDGQVLVINDMLGLNPDFSPRFVRSFATLSESFFMAVEKYVQSVHALQFPNEKESFI